MKLKAVLLVALAAAGVGASIAVADTGKGNDQGREHGCRALHVSGTIAPQTFTLTLTHGVRTGTATSSTVTVTIGGAGQTVRATVEGCTGVTGTKTPTLAVVRSVLLQAFRTPSTAGDDHHGGTTTTTTGKTAASHP